MKDLNTIYKKFNFRKILLSYIAFFVIALIITGSLLAYAYRNKIFYVYNYIKVSDKIEDSKIGVNAVKPDIIHLANEASDIVDIIVLDKHNKITFSAKNSELNHNDIFQLDWLGKDDNRYLTNPEYPNIAFKLIRNESLMMSTVLLNRDSQIQKNYKNYTFFADNYSAKKIYLLSYTIDKGTGDKIYFISDIHPVTNGPLYTKIVLAVFILFLMIYIVMVALWVYQDARKSKINYFLWGFIVLFTNFAGLFVYLIFKQNNQVCLKCGALQNKGNIHCIHCGTKINITCTDCNAITSVDAKYCHHCGKTLK